MQEAEVKFPISEIFTSPQGEGLWAGTRMTFIRFAGCNVGKPIPVYNDLFIFDGKEKVTEQYGIIPIWQEECTTADGRKFCCDTDFRVKERLTVNEILDQVPDGVEHICITGGEPLIHPLEPLFEAWVEQHKSNPNFISTHSIHIETSGTKIIRLSHGFVDDIWVTVSPKLNCTDEMIDYADEIKLLVDENFNEEFMTELVKKKSFECIVWLSPINGISELNEENKRKCLEIQERHPTWRITLQQHKILGVR